MHLMLVLSPWMSRLFLRTLPCELPDLVMTHASSVTCFIWFGHPYNFRPYFLMWVVDNISCSLVSISSFYFSVHFLLKFSTFSASFFPSLRYTKCDISSWALLHCHIISSIRMLGSSHKDELSLCLRGDNVLVKHLKTRFFTCHCHCF